MSFCLPLAYYQERMKKRAAAGDSEAQQPLLGNGEVRGPQNKRWRILVSCALQLLMTAGTEGHTALSFDASFWHMPHLPTTATYGRAHLDHTPSRLRRRSAMS